MGLLCAPVGGLVGLWISFNAIGDGYGVFVVAAPLAAFLSGSLLWWLFVVRRGRQYRILPAVAAGAFAAIFGHFLCWYLLLVAAFFWGGVTGNDRLSVNPLYAFPAAGVYGAFSLLFFGWVTVPAGAILGALLAIFQRRSRSNRTTAV
jgi:hypothetical protein